MDRVVTDILSFLDELQVLLANNPEQVSSLLSSDLKRSDLNALLSKLGRKSYQSKIDDFVVSFAQVFAEDFDVSDLQTTDGAVFDPEPLLTVWRSAFDQYFLRFHQERSKVSSGLTYQLRSFFLYSVPSVLFFNSIIPLASS